MIPEDVIDPNLDDGEFRLSGEFRKRTAKKVCSLPNNGHNCGAGDTGTAETD